MSNVEERVYTINLSRVTLAPRNRRSKRAINIIREFVSKHLKEDDVKIDTKLNELIWKNGIRHPPRRVRVKVVKEEGVVRVLPYIEGKTNESIPNKANS